MTIRRIGFHARSMEELKRLGSIENVNLLELKPDKLKEKGTPLYSFDGNNFEINHKLAKEISEFCTKKDIQINFHIPLEKTNDPALDEGLCQGIRQHHDLLLKRYMMIEELFKTYKIGNVVVMHPPQIRSNGKELCSYHNGLEYGRSFLYALDCERKKINSEIKLGIENMVGPKEDYITLGWNSKQLKILTGNTETIGLTVDSGHRLLSDEMSVAEMYSIAPIVSLHFHRNAGVFLKTGYKDDLHQFANANNLNNFYAYIRSIRRHKLPVTCEIGDLNSVSNKEIEDYVKMLRTHLE